MVDPATGTYLSEDYTFCHRFRKIGGKVWLDTKSRLTHVGSYAFQGQPPSAVAASTFSADPTPSPATNGVPRAA